MAAESGFVHTPVRQDDRLLLQTVCSHCGASYVGSHADGSLEHWEEEHRCQSKQAARGEAFKGMSRRDVILRLGRA